MLGFGLGKSYFEELGSRKVGENDGARLPPSLLFWVVGNRFERKGVLRKLLRF